MIKTTLKSLTLLAALAATTTFADVKAPNNKYYSAPYTNTVDATLMPATNIAVLNFSNDTIDASVPGLELTLLSGNTNTFRNETYWGNTLLTLQNSYHIDPFFNRYVCHRAVVTIDSTIDNKPGHYVTTVSNRYC